jgi:protein SCO1/2
MTRAGHALALLAGAVAVVAVVVGPGPAHAQLAAPPAVRQAGVDERPGAQLPLDLGFTDSTGRAVRLGDYFGDGKPLLLVMTYTRCAMLCSLVLRGTAKALAGLDYPPGRDFRVLNVSIDPRDTPHEAARNQAVMLEGIGLAGQPERWPFLVGEEPAIRALADSVGFRYVWDARTEQYAHPTVIFAIDPQGRVARYLYGFEFPPRALAQTMAEVRAGIPDASRAAGTAGSDSRPGMADAILACFRFETSIRLFGAPVQRVFQAGALLILIGLATTVALFFRRERRNARNARAGHDGRDGHMEEPS